MSITSGTHNLTVTLLTVCLEDSITRAVIDAAENRHWAVFHQAYENYISQARRPHFSDRLKASDGCIALINFERDPLQAATTATYLLEVFGKRAVVIAMAKEMTREVVLLAMRAGCTEFLAENADDSTLRTSLKRVEQQLVQRNTTGETSGSILALLGAKGGVGTTTLAVHLATFLVETCKKKVLLIDNQSQFGHVCIYLGLDGASFNFQEVVRNVDRLDSELLRGFVAKHPSGLDVLSSPDVGQTARVMNVDDVAATLEFFRTIYDFVVVDCAGRLDDVSRAVIAASAHVYVVATPEISALRDLSRYVDDLRQHDDGTKVKAVINRYSSQFAVSLAEIEKAIRMPVSYSVPNSYVELVRSANLGVPLAASSQNGFTKELLSWAKALVGATVLVEAETAKHEKQSFCGALVQRINRRFPLSKKVLSRQL